MENILTLISIISIVFAILQIILFFKLWGMTNDVKELKKMYEQNGGNSTTALYKIFNELQKANTNNEQEAIGEKVKQEKLLLEHAKENAPESESSVINEKSNDFKQYLRRWKILKDKGFIEQAVEEYMEYTQLEKDFAEDFISNL